MLAVAPAHFADSCLRCTPRIYVLCCLRRFRPNEQHSGITVASYDYQTWRLRHGSSHSLQQLYSHSNVWRYLKTEVQNYNNDRVIIDHSSVERLCNINNGGNNKHCSVSTLASSSVRNTSMTSQQFTHARMNTRPVTWHQITMHPTDAFLQRAFSTGACRFSAALLQLPSCLLESQPQTAV